MAAVRSVCTEVERNKSNRIIAYKIKLENGQINRFFPDELKQLIRSNKIIVENLKLTSDNKLIDELYNALKSYYPYEVHPLSFNNGAEVYECTGSIYYLCESNELEESRVDVWFDFRKKLIGINTTNHDVEVCSGEFNKQGLKKLINTFYQRVHIMKSQGLSL